MDEPPAYESGPSLPSGQAPAVPPAYAPSTIAIPLPEPFRISSIPWESLPKDLPLCDNKINIPLSLFAVISAYLDPKSIALLARTCKPLHDILTPALFYEPTISGVNFDGFLQSICNSDKPGWYVTHLDLTPVVSFLSKATFEFYGRSGSTKDLWEVVEQKISDHKTPQDVWLAVILRCCPALESLIFRTGGEPLWRTDSLRLALTLSIKINPPVIKKKHRRSLSGNRNKLIPPLDQSRPPARITTLVLRGSSTVNCLPTTMLQFLRQYCPIYVKPPEGSTEMVRLRYDFGMARSLVDKDVLKKWLEPPVKVKEKKPDPNSVQAAPSTSKSKGKGKGLFGVFKAKKAFKETISPPTSPTSPAKDESEGGTSEVPENPYVELDLDLSHLPGHVVEDSLIMTIAKMSVNFSHLSFAYSTSFSEFALSTMIASVPHIMHLTLAGCLQITQAILPTLFSSKIQILDIQYSGIKAIKAKFDGSDVREISLHYHGDSEGYEEVNGVHRMKSNITTGLQMSPELMARLPRLCRLNLCLNSPDEWQLRPTTDWMVIVEPRGKDASAFSPTQVVAKHTSKVLKNYVKPERAWAIPTPTMVMDLVTPLPKPCLIALSFMEEGKHAVQLVTKVYVPNTLPENSGELPTEHDAWAHQPLLGDLDIARLNAELNSKFGQDAVRIALAID